MGGGGGGGHTKNLKHAIIMRNVVVMETKHTFSVTGFFLN